jgi:hypothetical protein
VNKGVPRQPAHWGCAFAGGEANAFGENAAHQVSTITAITAFAAYFELLERRWRDLLADYNLAAGRTWPLVLVWLAAGPTIVAHQQR